MAAYLDHKVRLQRGWNRGGAAASSVGPGRS